MTADLGPAIRRLAPNSERYADDLEDIAARVEAGVVDRVTFVVVLREVHDRASRLDAIDEVQLTTALRWWSLYVEAHDVLVAISRSRALTATGP